MSQREQTQAGIENANLTGVRRKKIAEIVEERGSMAVRDLCEEFGMSEATIRVSGKTRAALSSANRLWSTWMKPGRAFSDA